MAASGSRISMDVIYFRGELKRFGIQGEGIIFSFAARDKPQ